MATLPPGFDLSALYADFSGIAAPFCACAFAFAVYAVIKTIIKRV